MVIIIFTIYFKSELFLLLEFQELWPLICTKNVYKKHENMYDCIQFVQKSCHNFGLRLQKILRILAMEEGGGAIYQNILGILL